MKQLTLTTLSARQKKQEGNYFDGFLDLNVDYDKRTKISKQAKVLEADMLSICQLLVTKIL